VPRSELRPDVYPPANAASSEILVRPAAEAEEIEIDEDELLRAQWYALLGELLAQAPDEVFLARLAALTGDDSELGSHIAALSKTAQRTTVEQVRDEFHDLFIGLSQGELLPYASYYLTGFLHEKPLAALRGAMAELGIVRATGRPEPEDHMASLCEAMAGLIVGAFGKPATLAVQRAFFAAHIAPWAEKFFADLAAAKSARLYMPVGQIGRIFIEIENAAFAMDEGDQPHEPNNG